MLALGNETLIRKQFFEVLVGLLFKYFLISLPRIILQENAKNFIPFPTNNRLSVEETSVFIVETHLLLSTFLIPQKFILEKDLIVLIMELFLRSFKAFRILDRKTLWETF